MYGVIKFARNGLTNFFFFQAEDGIRDRDVTGVQTCALPISRAGTPRNDTRARGRDPAPRSRLPRTRVTAREAGCGMRDEWPPLARLPRHRIDRKSVV